MRRVPREHSSPLPASSLVSFVGSLPVPGSNLGSQLGIWKVFEQYIAQTRGQEEGGGGIVVYFLSPFFVLGFLFPFIFFFSFGVSSVEQHGTHVFVCMFIGVGGELGIQQGKGCRKIKDRFWV